MGAVNARNFHVKKSGWMIMWGEEERRAVRREFLFVIDVYFVNVDVLKFHSFTLLSQHFHFQQFRLHPNSNRDKHQGGQMIDIEEDEMKTTDSIENSVALPDRCVARGTREALHAAPAAGIMTTMDRSLRHLIHMFMIDNRLAVVVREGGAETPAEVVKVEAEDLVAGITDEETGTEELMVVMIEEKAKE
jgi:hypothetical protein